MYDGPIIDSHHHLWEVANYPWLMAPPSPKMYGSEYEGLRQNYLVSDLRDDFGDNNVVGSVHVQANYDPSDPVGETKWLQSVADAHGFPHAIVGHAVMTDPDVERIIAGHCEYANTRGVRHQLHYWEGIKVRQRTDRPDLCNTPEFRRGMDLLPKYGMTFDLQGFTHQFVHFAELVRDYPGTRFCLVHAGMLSGSDDETVSAYKRGMEMLSAYPNLFIKCSGLNMLTARLDPPHMAIQLDTALDAFGADRCFYGSNFPLEKLWTSYDDLVAVYREVLSKWSDEDQRKFFHDTVVAFYGM
jgi:predicted TIM-barrel fold metal-dependent hydrolase